MNGTLEGGKRSYQSSALQFVLIHGLKRNRSVCKHTLLNKRIGLVARMERSGTNSFYEACLLGYLLVIPSHLSIDQAFVSVLAQAANAISVSSK